MTLTPNHTLLLCACVEATVRFHTRFSSTLLTFF